MKKFAVFLLSVLCFFSILVSPSFAADIRANSQLHIGTDEQNLSDLYLFGNTITLDAPVKHDVVAAGGTLALNSEITGDLIAAGGTVQVNAPVIGTTRVAGGNLTITKPTGRDLIIAGGTITITKEAAVSGDLVVNGGQIDVEAPVTGKLIVNGGDVRINNRVGKDVQANVDVLTLGSNATIGGNLTYHSGQQAHLESGSSVAGRTDYTKVERERHAAQNRAKSLITGFSVYALFATIIFGLMLLWLLRHFLVNVFERIDESPVATGFIGLISLVVMPIISFFLLLLILPGILSFLLYMLLLILAHFTATFYLGNRLVAWWYSRSDRVYAFDWQAVIAGAVAVFLISLMPIIGWLITSILYLLAIGGLTKELLSIREAQAGTSPAISPSPVERLQRKPASPKKR